MVDNHQTMSAHPIEVKSGKDYTTHSALNNLLNNTDYNVLSATVISNERKVYQDGKVTYMPVYFVMFMEADTPQADGPMPWTKKPKRMYVSDEECAKGEEHVAELRRNFVDVVGKLATGDTLRAWSEYLHWGGLPESVGLSVKRDYLTSTLQKIYLGVMP